MTHGLHETDGRDVQENGEQTKGGSQGEIRKEIRHSSAFPHRSGHQ